MAVEFYPRADERVPGGVAFFPADPAAARTLTAEQVEAFNRDGFLNGLPAFDAAQAEGIRRYIDGLVDAVVSAPDRRNSYSIAQYHLVCQGMYDLIQTPALLDYVQDIIGPDIVCWGTQLFCKLPADGKVVPLHQDATYWGLTPTKTVTVWLAIDDADVENAAMEFVPGSHLRGLVEHEDLGLDGTRILRQAAVNPGQFGARFTNALKAGTLSLHSDLLLHGSGPNRSARRRAGLTIRYVAAEVRRLSRFESFFANSVHCRGEIPDHWPNRRRPEGEHPEKMAQVFGEFDGTPADI